MPVWLETIAKVVFYLTHYLTAVIAILLYLAWWIM